MSSLQSIGRPPTGGRGLENVFQANAQLNEATTSRASVDGKVISFAAAKATKQYVDDRDVTGPDGTRYADQAYMQQQDNLYFPTSAKGVPGGLALLDSTGRVPASICPTLGTGYLKGPWGHQQAFLGSSTNGYKQRIASWTTTSGVGYPGVTAYKCQILAWASVAVKSSQGRPVVDIRLGGPADDNNYGAQVLIARGVGTLYYDDWQVVTVQPCADSEQYTAGRIPQPAASGQAGGYIDANFDVRLTMWLYDEVGTSQLTDLTHIAATSAWVQKVLT